jgi:hypothetical protein
MSEQNLALAGDDFVCFCNKLISGNAFALLMHLVHSRCISRASAPAVSTPKT